MERVAWPLSLQQLKFSDDFNQPIEGVAWPALQQLKFVFFFNQPTERVTWPSSLKHLDFGRNSTAYREGSLAIIFAAAYI